MSVEAPPTPAAPLARSAIGALIWGGGFTLLRDVAQFGVMLVLVRLLTPADYGAMSLAQSIVGVASMASFVTFSTHALQHRDPNAIDWQAQFTAGLAMNSILLVLTLVVAAGLALTERYHAAAGPLAALSLSYVVEVPGTLRQRMLECTHDWARLRTLLMLGTLAGMGCSLAIGVAGGGVWALAVQPPLLALPNAIDLFIKAKFRPRLVLDAARYREMALFGLNRFGAGAGAKGRLMVEQFALSNTFSLATLGEFNRAVGLGTLAAGRIGAVAVGALYPVITRAERGSDRFRRMSALVLRGICWVSAPAAVFLVAAPADIVTLLYGARWTAVIPLLPLAAIFVAVSGVGTVVANLLVANEDAGAGLAVDIAMAVGGVLIALTVVQSGPAVYLEALIVMTTIVVSGGAAVLVKRGALDLTGLLWALLPAMSASLAATGAVSAANVAISSIGTGALRLAVTGSMIGLVYLMTLRLLFARALAELTDVLPASSRLRRGLLLKAE